MGRVVQFPKPKTLWGRIKWWWRQEQNLARQYRKKIAAQVAEYKNQSKK